MTEKTYFFSHLLGRHWGTEVRVSPSNRSGYRICIHAGEEPNIETGTVLHLNLNDQIGLHDSGMHWRVYLGGGERVGHAWDDNQPDPPLMLCPFEDWVLDRVLAIIEGLSKSTLHRAYVALTNEKPKSREELCEIRLCLLQAEEHLELESRLTASRNERDLAAGVCDDSEEYAWKTTLSLAQCALKLGEFDEVVRFSERFTNGYFPKGFTCLAMTNSVVQELIPPLIMHDEAFWCSLMRAPMKRLANFPTGVPVHGDSARLSFFGWLRTVDSPQLVETWVESMLQAKIPHARLSHYASLLNFRTMVNSVVALIDAAIEQAGEGFEYLILLGKALKGSDLHRRLEENQAKLASMGFNEKIVEVHDEFNTLCWPIWARYQHHVAAEHREALVRLLELEDILNANWRSYSIEDLPSHIFRGPLVCVGTLLWVEMCRTADEPGEAIERIEATFSDWDLVGLLNASDSKNMEALIDVACLAYIESQESEGLVKAHQLLKTVLEKFPPTENGDTNYNYACVFALCGDVEGALEQLEPFIERGDPEYIRKRISRIRADKDFEGICKIPRFAEAMKGWAIEAFKEP